MRHLPYPYGNRSVVQVNYKMEQPLPTGERSQRMKRIILSLVLMFLVALPVMAQSDEPRLGVHGILNNGEAVSSEFSDESGMHLYTFAGNGDDVVTIRMEGEDEVDPYLIVLGSDGEVLGSNDDSDGL